MTCGILVSWPGIDPVPSATEGWSLNHWTLTGKSVKPVLSSVLNSGVTTWATLWYPWSPEDPSVNTLGWRAGFLWILSPWHLANTLWVLRDDTNRLVSPPVWSVWESQSSSTDWDSGAEGGGGEGLSHSGGEGNWRPHPAWGAAQGPQELDTEYCSVPRAEGLTVSQG